MTTIQFLHQIFAKIISIIAGLIIAIGLVEMPALPSGRPALPSGRPVEYQAPPRKTSTTSQTQTLNGKEKISLPSQTESQAKTPLTIPSVPSQKPLVSEPPIPALSLTELNKQIRKTIVNIICENQAGGSFNAITGSGIIVSSKGVILTTAHVGQYFLLENTPETGYLNCIIRNGDIAQPAYKAELVYIPSVWVEENVENIIQQKPKGTGENDYALLLITESIVQGKKLPENFNFTEPNFDFNILPVNFSALLASYPAEFISGIEVQKNLGLTSTFAEIGDLFTFAKIEPATLDLFSVKGSIISQSGSSGGAVVDATDGKLLGIITTSSEGTTTASRTLNAITITHIKRSFEKYTGKPLSYFLETPEDYNVLLKTESSRLENLLIKELNKR